MKKALMMVAVLAVAGFVSPADAECAKTTDTHRLSLADGISITASESTPNAGCTGGVTRHIVITQGTNSCVGAPADVVTDPFGFGGGARSATAETCGANATVGGHDPTDITPLTPTAADAQANPPYAYAALSKPMYASSGWYQTPWGNGTIPAGTPGSLTREFTVSA